MIHPPPGPHVCAILLSFYNSFSLLNPYIDRASLCLIITCFLCVLIAITISQHPLHLLSAQVYLSFSGRTGQIFCTTHTNLGFSRSMNSSIAVIETQLGVNNILGGFMVQIEHNSKNGSLAGQFVDCITRLVGMELKHKPVCRLC